MENSNPLDQYIGRNLTKIISGFEVQKNKTKDGVTYYSFDLILNNGYKHRLFLKNSEQFAFVNAIDQLDANKMMEM